MEHQNKLLSTKTTSLTAEACSTIVRYRALPTTGNGAGPAQLYLQRPRLSLKLGHWEGKKELKQKELNNHCGMKANNVFTESLPIPPL